MRDKSQTTGKAASDVRAGPDLRTSSQGGMRTRQTGGLRIKPQGATEAHSLAAGSDDPRERKAV